MVFDVSLEMQSESKNYVSVEDDEITELVHTIKWQALDTCKIYAYISRQRYFMNCYGKLLLNLMRKCDVCLEQPSDSKIIMDLQWTNSASLCVPQNHNGLYPTAGHGLKQTESRQSEIFTEFRLKSSIRPIESIWCFFRNVKRS